MRIIQRQVIKGIIIQAMVQSGVVMTGNADRIEAVSYTHLREVDQAGFAVVDANLYLDTHPCDAAAIDYYNQMANAYRNAAAAFEAQFGPLTASANTDAAYWSWINDPWPWEGGCY